MTYFGMRLSSLRKEDSMTQLELANSIGVKKSTIGMWENGKREPDFEMLETIADFFNVPISTFFPPDSSGPENKKTVTIDSDGLDELDMKFVQMIKQLSDQEKQMLVAQMEGLLRTRGQ
jgi:transcriptional regulator with XRE-family HTH domain